MNNLKISDVKKLKYGYTHAGKFHADDVFSTAFLLSINPNFEIKRVNHIVDCNDGIIYDIGGGKFDHHMIGKDVRENGKPYASFGKLWREFGEEMYGKYVYEKVDKRLIEELDYSDNTGAQNSLAYAISLFNPFDYSDADKCFWEAVEFAKVILAKEIKKEQMREKELKIVEKVYEETNDKRVLVFDKHLFFQDLLPFKETIYVIYPSNRGCFCAQGVPVSPETTELKKPFPKAWTENLPSYVKFCHKNCFLISTDTLEEAIHACREALK